MQKIDAIIRVHFNINPEELSDEDWAKLFQQWVYVSRIQMNAQQAMLEGTFKKVLIEVVNDVFAAMNKTQPARKKNGR